MQSGEGDSAKQAISVFRRLFKNYPEEWTSILLIQDIQKLYEKYKFHIVTTNLTWKTNYLRTKILFFIVESGNWTF